MVYSILQYQLFFIKLLLNSIYFVQDTLGLLNMPGDSDNVRVSGCTDNWVMA